MTFLGYERPDGQAGIRNWVGVISVMDNVNPITRSICGNVNGTIPITTLFVRGQYGRDLKISYDSLAGMGRNPNLDGVVVVGPEEPSTNPVAARIRTSGPPFSTVPRPDLAGP